MQRIKSAHLSINTITHTHILLHTPVKPRLQTKQNAKLTRMHIPQERTTSKNKKFHQQTRRQACGDDCDRISWESVCANVPKKARHTTTTKKNQITFNSGYFQGSSHMKNITDYCQEESKRSKIFKLYLVAQCLQSPKRGSEDMITLFSYIQSNHTDVVL